MYEKEEVASQCTAVEGIDAEVEAAGFAEKEVLQLRPGLLPGAASTACQCTPSRPASSTTSSFSTSCFCKRLEHSMNVMLAGVHCL